MKIKGKVAGHSGHNAALRSKPEAMHIAQVTRYAQPTISPHGAVGHTFCLS